MDRLNRLASVGALTLSGLCAAATLEAAPIRCDTCVTDEDFKARALEHGPGTHYVFNLPANVIQTWRVPAPTRSNSTKATALSAEMEASAEPASSKEQAGDPER
ncbi:MULTISPECIES: hypothetical protein [Luteimonas]|uniref:hypothetical protein n=1 Tax=Luteimonas TaxID=83614 RepID=UPI000F4EB98C|nr:MULTISPECIES: hypothetical protein [Luteimonas]